MSFLNTLRAAVAAKLTRIATKLGTHPLVPFTLPRVVQHTNPAKNAIRKAKKRMGARQFRIRMKEFRRTLKGAQA